MFSFLKKNPNTKEKDNLLSKTASLFIHAAKIDENYTDEEKEIIKKALVKLGAKESEVNLIISNAEINEENSNQILDFTKEIKNAGDEFKVQIMEALWNIIYSDKKENMYESNLMRRLAGLLYLDNRVMGDIKKKAKQKINK
tara:strand:+ start:498 stop:923 length:426 start_codon:yes stop_codon:yes gene_type:complete